jgi:monovalent cation:H+ antiporter, CPA1 family
MDFSIQKIEWLLLTAAVVAMLTRKLRIPYSVGLVLAGMMVSYLGWGVGFELNQTLLFNTLLPPLIFEAALCLSWNELRQEWKVITLIATVGVILSTGVTAFGMHVGTHWPWLSALLFGTLTAATDPVAVIATFKEAGVQGRLRLLVEGESLLNDGSAAVLFGLILSFHQTHTPNTITIATHAFLVIAGGITAGALIAALALFLAGKTKDHLIEITFSVITAYGSFLLAEHFHFSGILSTLSAGLLFGHSGFMQSISAKGRETIEAFWEYHAFAANSIIFLLIGIQTAQQPFLGLIFPAGIAILITTLSRACAVYPLCGLFARTPERLAASHQHLLFWGGLKGALGLTLALSLPHSIPFKHEIITCTFAIVAFSSLVQATTIPFFIRRTS